MMSKKFVIAIVAMCLWALVVLPATAEMVTGSNTTYVKTYALDSSKVDTIAGICFDPSYQDTVTGDYDRLFLLNRGRSSTTRNLYWTSPATESLSSGLPIAGIPEGDLSADPTDVVADSNGTVYIKVHPTKAYVVS